ncbi:hypothetical protein SNEBB_002391 [Seison nebaliae]|nr:hypothetical protein SNEBB_002391 [Seison nebaliae]
MIDSRLTMENGQLRDQEEKRKMLLDEIESRRREGKLKCRRTCFVIMSFLLFIGGFSIMVYGSVLLSEHWKFISLNRIVTNRCFSPILEQLTSICYEYGEPDRDPWLYYICISMIFSGIVLMLIGSLSIYAIYRIVLMALQLSLVLCLIIWFGSFILTLLSGIYVTQWSDELQIRLSEAIRSNYTGRNTTFDRGIDFLQTIGQCCGMSSFVDYTNSKYKLTTGKMFPPSCCRMYDGRNREEMAFDNFQYSSSSSVLCQNGNGRSRYSVGCFDILKEWVIDYSIQLGCTMGSIFFLQLIYIYLAMWLLQKIGKQEKFIRRQLMENAAVKKYNSLLRSMSKQQSQQQQQDLAQKNLINNNTNFIFPNNYKRICLNETDTNSNYSNTFQHSLQQQQQQQQPLTLSTSQSFNPNIQQQQEFLLQTTNQNMQQPLCNSDLISSIPQTFYSCNDQSTFPQTQQMTINGNNVEFSHTDSNPLRSSNRSTGLPEMERLQQVDQSRSIYGSQRPIASSSLISH